MTTSMTPRTDALLAKNNTDLARTLEREAAMLKEGLLARMSLISSQEEIIARLREALKWTLEQCAEPIHGEGSSYGREYLYARAALEVQP